jgi:hypothetical protein
MQSRVLQIRSAPGSQSRRRETLSPEAAMATNSRVANGPGPHYLKQNVHAPRLQ